jgi:hypothetical protein
MRSRIAQQVRRDDFDRAQQSAQGNIRSLMLFTSSRAAQLSIADMQKMPSVENTTRLQDVDGNTYFTIGYSAIGGGHIIP